MNLARRPQIETYLFSALAKMQLEVKKNGSWKGYQVTPSMATFSSWRPGVFPQPIFHKLMSAMPRPDT